MEKDKEMKIPIRVRIISEIKDMLSKAAKRDQGIFVEKLIAAYMEKEGTPRRLIIECIDSVKFSGFAKYEFNAKKEKIIKKK